MTTGCLLGYWLGKRFARPEELRRMEEARLRWGDWLVVLFRPVPVLAEASVFFAGVTRMPFRRFAALSGLSNLGISAVYAWAGAHAAGTETFLWAFVAALAVPGLGMLVFSPRRASRRSPE
jgi:membrane protein DedA with SNARE-associated domain